MMSGPQEVIRAARARTARALRRAELWARIRFLDQCSVSVGAVCKIAGSGLRAPLGFGSPRWLSPGESTTFIATASRDLVPQRMHIVTAPAQPNPPCIVSAITPEPWAAGTEVAITVARALAASGEDDDGQA